MENEIKKETISYHVKWTHNEKTHDNNQRLPWNRRTKPTKFNFFLLDTRQMDHKHDKTKFFQNAISID